MRVYYQDSPVNNWHNLGLFRQELELRPIIKKKVLHELRPNRPGE